VQPTTATDKVTVLPSLKRLIPFASIGAKKPVGGL
jgi:hypothetical protein